MVLKPATNVLRMGEYPSTILRCIEFPTVFLSYLQDSPSSVDGAVHSSLNMTYKLWELLSTISMRYHYPLTIDEYIQEHE